MKAVRLLLVEDDRLVADIVADALAEAGYEVVRAADGPEGAELLDHYADDLRGLITDVEVGGGLDGWASARSARERRPQIAIVYITGEGPDQWPAEGVPNSLLIPKPFATSQVVAAIASLLNQNSSPPTEAQG